MHSHQVRAGNSQPGYIGTNAFAALDTSKTKKKKKSGKDKEDKSKKDKSKSSSHAASGLNPSIIPAAAEIKFDELNWAEEDDDDGFALAPMAGWVQEHHNEQLKAQAAQAAAPEEPEVEDNHDNMVNITAQLGMEVAHDEETDEDESESQDKPASRNVSEITQVTNSQACLGPKIEEKQLTKKELKQKEMEELAAVLGELGIDAENISSQPNEPSESALKRKKKKERAKLSQAKNEPVQNAADGLEESSSTPQVPETVASQSSVKLIDPAEAKKKLAAGKSAGSKKKKPANAAMARAAAEEAKARAAKEAAQKDKDKKKHYNQERR